MKQQIVQIRGEVTIYFLCCYCLLPHFQIKLQCRKRFSHINPFVLQREGQTDLNQEQSEIQSLQK